MDLTLLSLSIKVFEFEFSPMTRLKTASGPLTAGGCGKARRP